MSGETARPAWPKGNWGGEPDDERRPTLAEVTAYWAGLGCAQASVSIDLVHDPRWRLNAEIVMHAHDVVYLLNELAAVDLGRAERAAHGIWLAAEAGDSYGEWLWQWANDAGLNADAVCAEAAARLAENPPANGRRPSGSDGNGTES